MGHSMYLEYKNKKQTEHNAICNYTNSDSPLPPPMLLHIYLIAYSNLDAVRHN